VIPDSEDPSAPGSEGARFVTTHWSAVARAGGADAPGRRAALAELCQSYWYPLYAFARRQGHSPPDAEDLTQGFFARLLEANTVAGAQPEKGRFRSYLITAFKRYLAHDWERRHAQKRGGFCEVVSMDLEGAEAALESELRDAATPEALYDRQWALTTLETVLTRLEEEYVASGRAALFEHLRPCVGGEESALPYATIAARLKLTEPAVKMAVRRLRLRYRELLREEIAKTVQDESEVEDEIRCLFAAFNC
jgi:RNA polymerase sigma-70 factor (ECF subfamily)